MAKRSMQEFTIRELEHEIERMEQDEVDEKVIERKRGYLKRLQAKAERAKKATDMVSITRKEKDGTVRVRKCAKTDIARFENQGYELVKGQQVDENDPLAVMTKAQLVDHAAELEIDLTGCKTKAQILAAINAAE